MAGPRTVVRSTPYAVQRTWRAEVVADAASIEATFDLALVLTDRNQLEPGVSVSRPAVGPYLDAAVRSTGIGELDVIVDIDRGAVSASLLAAPIPVPAVTLVPIVGLRIPARYVTVRFTNTSGGDATVAFGIFIRSN